jgi:ubiquitin-conjugating enzyme E2 J1
MPTSPNGALGSLDYKKEERHTLAAKSREAAPKFGTPERQTLMDEIHEYMLSKAPPVPEVIPSQASEECSTENEIGTQTSPDDTGAQNLPDPAVNDEIVEPREGSQNANPPAAGVRSPIEDATSVPSNQVMRRPETRVQKPADDRLFTWAAVGLMIAIVVLLLKKFMKANGHGAVFMDGES